MTLGKGDLLGKLNKETKEQISPKSEGWVHWQVVELSAPFYKDTWLGLNGETLQMLLVRKIA